MRRPRWAPVALLVCALAGLAPLGSAAGEAGAGGGALPAGGAPARFRLRPFIESGVLVGGESRTPNYRESALRLYGEAGLELEIARGDSLRGHRFGLAASPMIGRDDRRLAAGPRGTWQFRPRWAVQAFAGPLWSTKEDESGLFDRGWHVRAGLLHGDIVSLNLVWQTLPYEARGPELRRGRSHALYGGVMAHGRVGALVSLGAWGAVAAIVVAVLSAYRSG